METRSLKGAAAALILIMVWCCRWTPFASAQDGPTESRLQAVLKLNGNFLPDGGGFRLTEAPSSGPGANLERPRGGGQTRGMLEAGDVVTEVEGKSFRDRREFLDLVNEAHRKFDGQVLITVHDVRTGRFVDWVVRPVVVRMDIPAARRPFDFLTELGRPVPLAPPVPAVPATIDL